MWYPFHRMVAVWLRLCALFSSFALKIERSIDIFLIRLRRILLAVNTECCFCCCWPHVEIDCNLKFSKSICLTVTHVQLLYMRPLLLNNGVCISFTIVRFHFLSRCQVNWMYVAFFVLLHFISTYSSLLVFFA